MAMLPCVLCGKELDRRTDKNGKAYFICDPCGMQLFVRRKQGMENLDRLQRTLKNRELPFREHAEVLFQIRAILEEMDGLEHELDKLENSFSFFSKTKKEKNRAKKLLKQRLQTLLSDLERIAG